MKIWKVLPLIPLLGCPAEPLDKQGNSNGEEKPPAGQQTGEMQKPPGTPPTVGNNANMPNATQGTGNANQPGSPPDQGSGPVQQIDPNNPPTFADLIQDGQSVKINVKVTNAEEYSIEFMYLEERDDRKQPALVHRQIVSSSEITIDAPKNYENELWVEIRSGTSGQPSEDDLSDGSKTAIKLGEEDLSLEFTLTKGEEWKQAWDWFSKEVPNPENPPQ